MDTTKLSSRMLFFESLLLLEVFCSLDYHVFGFGYTNLNSSREVMALRNQQEQRNNDHLQSNFQNDRIQISKEGKQLYLASAFS